MPRYKLLRIRETLLLIRDDGYRFCAMWLDGPEENVTREWVHVMEYKQCNWPFMSTALADELMKGGIDELQAAVVASGKERGTPEK